MELHVDLRIRLAALCVVDQLVCELVAVSIRTVALAAALRLDVGQRRAVGLGELSPRTLDMAQRILGLDALRILPFRPQLVASGSRLYDDLRQRRVLVSAAVPLPLLQLQLALEQRPLRRQRWWQSLSRQRKWERKRERRRPHRRKPDAAADARHSRPRIHTRQCAAATDRADNRRGRGQPRSVRQQAAEYSAAPRGRKV